LRKVRRREPLGAGAGTGGGPFRWAEMSEDAAFMREQARRCRRLARQITTPDVIRTLTLMAEDYETRAEKLEQAGK
jgi:hypothetical protein